jgi:tetratricopeptide (TPR) repeat protein
MSSKRRTRNKSAASNQPAAEVQKAEVPKPPRQAFSRRRRWLYRLAAMVVAPVLFFGLLEAGLRIGDYGHPTNFFVGPDANGAYTPNTWFGWRFFPDTLYRKPAHSLVSAKPAGTIRIFVLGSSAAFGIPNPSFSFGRILEVMLRERYPDVKFEVVNAAMAAINSHVVLDIARDCATHQPDLFVVYMGNNEVIGPYGPGSIFQKWSPSLKYIRANMWLKTTRSGQLLDDTVRRFHSRNGTPASWPSVETLLDNQVSPDDPRMETVYGNFRQNLIDLCRVARDADTAVILSTVAVNLRDCPPFASKHRPDMSPEELDEWESVCRAGVEKETKGRWTEAAKQYEAAAKIDGRFAELQFRLGRCLAKQGRPADARKRFELARDLDVLRFRADSRINSVIREVVAEEKTRGVRGVDAERALAESDLTPDGIAGERLFFEHVHLTFDGNYLLARAVMEQIEPSLPQLAETRKSLAILSRAELADLMVLTPWDEYQMALQISEMTSRPPFTNQFDHSARQAALQKRVEDLGERAVAPNILDASLKRCEAGLKRTPDDWDLHHRYGLLAMLKGESVIAVEHCRIALKGLPLEAKVHLHLGQALQNCGKIEEAILQFQRALEIEPLDSMAHNDLGNALYNLGRNDEALFHYRKALDIDPLDSLAHNNLGAALVNHGEIDDAIGHFQKALEISPSFEGARGNLEKAMKIRAGRAGRAIP